MDFVLSVDYKQNQKDSLIIQKKLKETMCLILPQKHGMEYQKKSAMNVWIGNQMEENFLSMKLPTHNRYFMNLNAQGANICGWYFISFNLPRSWARPLR